jgi:uncharacterized protein YdeI (YjbR/CyaY-like superfamily)
VLAGEARVWEVLRCARGADGERPSAEFGEPRAQGPLRDGSDRRLRYGCPDIRRWAAGRHHLGDLGAADVLQVRVRAKEARLGHGQPCRGQPRERLRLGTPRTSCDHALPIRTTIEPPSYTGREARSHAGAVPSTRTTSAIDDGAADVSAAAQERPRIEPGSREELRAWLTENHAASSGVLLAVGKKGGRVTALTYDEAIEEGLCFGWIDSTARRLDEDRYTVLFTPRRPRSVWSKSNKRRVERMEELGLMTPAGRTVVDRAREDGSWNLLTDADDLRVPEDLAAALTAERGAEAGFAALPVSTRQMVLFWIGSAKRPETRVRRVADTVRAAAEGRAPF